MRTFLAIASGLVLALSACGPTAPAPTPASNAIAPAAPAVAASPVAGQPTRGGTLRIPIQTDPLPLNPVLSNELSSLLVRKVLFSYLTRVDPQSGNPVPDLATRWEAAPDGLSWTFTLRDNVKWHDGQPFTSEDVKFTFDAIANPANNSVERSNYADVLRIETPDSTTVRFVLKNPLASLPVIAGATVGILPKHLLDGQDLRQATAFNTRLPIGTGPYRVKTVAAGSYIELTAFDDFYRGRPNIDTLIFNIVPDTNTQMAQLKSGELDFATVEPTNLAAVQSDSNLRIDTLNAPEILLLNLNHQNPLFVDKRVNQALEFGLDRQGILDGVAQGKGALATGPLPPALQYWYDTSIKPRPFDTEQAKSLLGAAGWTPGPDGILVNQGQRFAFTIMVDQGSAVRAQIAVLAQQFWKRLGLDVAIETVERTVYGDRLNTHKFEATVTDRPSAWDPDNQRRFYACGAGSNFGQYCNQEADRLLAAGVAEMDPAKRQTIYFQYEHVVFDDPVWVPLYYPQEIRASTTRLKGVPNLPLRDVLQYVDSWSLDH